MEFLRQAVTAFNVSIFSSRSINHKGIEAMQRWLAHWLQAELGMSINDCNTFAFSTLDWPTTKPAAFVTLDDRAVAGAVQLGTAFVACPVSAADSGQATKAVPS